MLVALCTGEVCDGVVVRRYTHTVCVQKYDMVHSPLLALHVQQAQAQLGQLRVEAHRIKTSLETTISQHKEALKEAKTIEKQIQVGHSHLSCSLSPAVMDWRPAALGV